MCVCMNKADVFARVSACVCMSVCVFVCVCVITSPPTHAAVDVCRQRLGE